MQTGHLSGAERSDTGDRMPGAVSPPGRRDTQGAWHLVVLTGTRTAHPQHQEGRHITQVQELARGRGCTHSLVVTNFLSNMGIKVPAKRQVGPKALVPLQSYVAPNSKTQFCQILTLCLQRHHSQGEANGFTQMVPLIPPWRQPWKNVIHTSLSGPH